MAEEPEDGHVPTHPRLACFHRGSDVRLHAWTVNAGRTPHPPLDWPMAVADPDRLFLQAEAFHAASRKLLPERDATPEQFAPYIANSVFALELYLKCLLMCVKGKYPQVHSAQALFFDLPEAEIERLRKLHRRIYRLHFPASDAFREPGLRDDAGTYPVERAADDRLDEILAGAKDAFHVARYFYERAGAASAVIPDVTVVTTVVRGRILELEPSWQVWAE